MAKLLAQQISEHISSLTTFAKVIRIVHVKGAINQKIIGEAQAWVIDLFGSPEPSVRDIGSPVQPETVVCAVVIGLKAPNDPLGEKAVTKLDAMRLALRQQLFGWSPQDYDPIELAGHELLHEEAGVIYWVERFRSKHLIHKDNLL